MPTVQVACVTMYKSDHPCKKIRTLTRLGSFVYNKYNKAFFIEKIYGNKTILLQKELVFLFLTKPQSFP